MREICSLLGKVEEDWLFTAFSSVIEGKRSQIQNQKMNGSLWIQEDCELIEENVLMAARYIEPIPNVWNPWFENSYIWEKYYIYLLALHSVHCSAV